MANIEDCPGFETFGADVKAARQAKRRVIVDGMHLLHASGHAGPKSYRSSWEGPALSFFGAGGAS